jgi:hypothetical protein
MSKTMNSTMTYKIEKIGQWRVSKTTPPTRNFYEHHNCGFLVTGYPDGSDWLVSPMGRNIGGRIVKHAPDFGWALGWDRQQEYRLHHLYVLDLPQKSIREVERLSLTRECRILGDYDNKHLIALVNRESPDSEDRWPREIIFIDIATAKAVNRFRTGTFAYNFRNIARCPGGWLKIFSRGPDPDRENAWVAGFVEIQPLTRQAAFRPFPLSGHESLTISRSGRHVLRENLARLPRLDLAKSHPAPADFDGRKRRYGRSVQLWSGEPYAYQRDLVLGWSGIKSQSESLSDHYAALRCNLEEIFSLCAEPRADPMSCPKETADQWTAKPKWKTIAQTHWEFAKFPWNSGGRLPVWQEDETAFWFDSGDSWTCVGLDGTLSPPVILKGRLVSFTARPGRTGEAVVELDHGHAKYIVDGSPSDDPFLPREAPPATYLPTDAGYEKRQRKAQTELTKIVKSSTALRISLPSLQLDDCVGAINAMSSALDRGLKWYADRDSVFQLSIKVAGSKFDEARFFDHVESLGPAVMPALSNLLNKCCADPENWTVWSLELEDGCQAFGPAAKALGAVDAGAWPQLAEYLMHVDDGHEGYFRRVTERHFIKTHGWRDESFNLSLSVIVQMRGNLGDAYVPVWRNLKLAPAAERAYSPEEFATRMLAVRDRMLSSAAGSFAASLAMAAADAGGRQTTHGWRTYDDLFEQIREDLTPWEERLFEELRRRS